MKNNIKIENAFCWDEEKLKEERSGEELKYFEIEITIVTPENIAKK